MLQASRETAAGDHWHLDNRKLQEQFTGRMCATLVIWDHLVCGQSYPDFSALRASLYYGIVHTIRDIKKIK